VPFSDAPKWALSIWCHLGGWQVVITGAVRTTALDELKARTTALDELKASVPQEVVAVKNHKV
jgi:hypothetical protein